MARARRREPEPQTDATLRDFVLARLAASRNAAQAAIDAIDETVALFMDPSEDPGGDERKKLMDGVLQALQDATAAAECGEAELGEVDMKEVEPWEEP